MVFIKDIFLKFKGKCICFLLALFAIFFSFFCFSEGFNVYGEDQVGSKTVQSKTSQSKDKGDRENKFFQTQKGKKADKGGLVPKYKKGELLVKFKDGVSESEANAIHKDVGAIVKKTYKKTRVQLVQLPEVKDIQEAIDDYKKTAKVEYAEPNYWATIDSTTPNDPRFSKLWGLHNTGQTGGTTDADVDATEAWDLFRVNSGVVVGVIDSGVDYKHVDLQENIWVNPFETPGDRIDNDGNGFVDDIHGINAITLSGDPMDDYGHGTHVSGIIGAVGNNGEGVVGVNWHVKIMGLKCLDSDGHVLISNALTCIEYVLDMKDRGVNIKVTNNSWGSTGYSSALYDAINELRSSGILFVASVGNSGTDNDISPRYPASYNLDNIIAVTATDHNDNLASFSNYGVTSVDLGAPGVDILSTLPLSYTNCDYVCNSTLFFDDMESGIGNWRTGGTNNTWAITNEQSYSPSNAWSDSPNSYYLNYTDSYFMLANDLNLSGVTDEVVLSFNATYDLGAITDSLYVEVSGDGGATWQIIRSLIGSSPWKSFEFLVLPSNVKTSQFRCRFRLITDDFSVVDGVYIDDVRICTLATTTYFSDNMESGEGNWTTSGTNNTWAITNEQSSSPSNAWSDSPYANYLNNTYSFLTLAKDVNLFAVTDDVTIFFNARHVLGAYDNVSVDISGNGGALWLRIGVLDGHTYWSTYRFAVPSDFKTSQFRCRFRLVTDYSFSYDGVYIDDVRIVGMVPTCEIVNNYDWYSGTSMATPHVVGAAALIWGYSPAANYLDVAGIMMTTVDPLASLNGITVSGGRLNLYNALQQVNRPGVLSP